ncbi:MAG TPA: squalene/phytoene synthase family protein [Stellaceae bacterium]|nr:squalene/phytoene synthase family protein [Stellaceae bacterium]
MSPVAALVRRHDRDRFQTALFAPAPAREALFALYAFNYEIARIRESVREPMLGRIRLQWWREAIEAAYVGDPPRRHDVAEALAATIRARHLTRAHFERLIDSREGDLDDAAPPTLAALEDYAEASSSRLIRLALEALDAATPAAQDAATEIGIGYALSGLLRALPLQARAGRTMIPGEIAAAAGLCGGAALRPGAALSRAAAAIAGAARRRLALGRDIGRAAPRAALPALLPARVAEAALGRLERAGFDPFAAAAGADPLQSWRLAWAAWRGRF